MLSFHDIEDFQEIDATLAEQADADKRNADPQKDQVKDQVKDQPRKATDRPPPSA